MRTFILFTSLIAAFAAFGQEIRQDQIEAGRNTFQTYCAVCHGKEGRGNGRAAKLYSPPPFNLTLSTAPRDDIRQIIQQGGASLNRNPVMPAWGGTFTESELNELLSFLWSIRSTH